MGGEAIILVVDPDASRAILMTRILCCHGYSAMAVNSAEEALKLSRSKKFKADLVLTRIVMEPMSGVDLARTIEREHLPVSVLLISHYPESILEGIPGFVEFSDRFIRNETTDENAVKEIVSRVTGTLASRNIQTRRSAQEGNADSAARRSWPDC